MIIIGNSHTAALRDAVALFDQDERKPLNIKGIRGRVETSVFFELRPEGLTIIDPELAQRVERMIGTTVIKPSLEWGFCFGHPGFISNVPAWKSCQSVEAGAAQTAGKQAVSAGVLRAFIEGVHANVLAFFEAAARAGITFTIILAPPPRRNTPAIVNLGLSLEQVRSIDRAARRVFLDKGAKLGARVVDAPPEAADEEGFLKAEFCAGNRQDGTPDPHHANAEYGKLMLRRIMAKT